MRKISFSLAAPVGAFVLTVIIATIALWIFGSDPFDAYGEMISHSRKLETQVDILNRATPFYLSATAAAIPACTTPRPSGSQVSRPRRPTRSADTSTGRAAS